MIRATRERIRRRRAAPLLCTALLAPVLAGCPGPRPYPGPDPTLPAAAGPIGEVEAALLRAPGAVVRFRVASRGAFETDLSGTLWIASGNRARLEATGRFGNESGDLLLVSDGAWLQHHDFRGPAREGRTPPRLNEALVVGLVRMGVLHNLALLTEAGGPDHAHAGVHEWLRPVDAVLRERDDGTVAVEYELEVDGEPSAHVTLLVDPRIPAPIAREQTVRFPGGEMRVEERYPLVRTDVVPDPALFELESMPLGTAPAPGETSEDPAGAPAREPAPAPA